jgi:hypothetical protein
MAVKVAVETLAQDGHGSEFVHDRGNSDLNELFVSAVAVRDVSRGDIAACGRPGGCRRAWLGGLVGSVEDEVCGVEVEAVEGEFSELDGLGGDGGKDGMALGEESVECSSEAVIVERIGWDVPEEVGAGAVGPGGNVDEGSGLAQPGGE